MSSFPYNLHKRCLLRVIKGIIFGPSGTSHRFCCCWVCEWCIQIHSFLAGAVFFRGSCKVCGQLIGYSALANVKCMCSNASKEIKPRKKNGQWVFPAIFQQQHKYSIKINFFLHGVAADVLLVRKWRSFRIVVKCLPGFCKSAKGRWVFQFLLCSIYIYRDSAHVWIGFICESG